MKKLIISLFMCRVMAFSLLPTAAWAELLSVTEDGQQERVVADPSGDEVQPGDEGENVGGEDAAGGAEGVPDVSVKKKPAPRLCRGADRAIQLFRSSSCRRSAIMAMNSELVGLPLAEFTV